MSDVQSRMALPGQYHEEGCFGLGLRASDDRQPVRLARDGPARAVPG